MKTRVITLNATLLAISATWVLSSGGPLDPPPGPPTSNVYKTLDQVEARTPISAAGTIISTPGSYYLTANITGASGQNGIEIQASDVTLDLNGFALDGGGIASGSLDGILVTGARTGIAVRNGTVADWAGDGVDAAASEGSQFGGLRLTGNGQRGMAAGAQALVEKCTFAANGGAGLAMLGDGLVTHCSAKSNSGFGFTADAGCLFEHCHAASNTGGGFFLHFLGVAKTCVAKSNAGPAGFDGLRGCKVIDCASSGNTGAGIRLEQDGMITGCLVRINESHGIHLPLGFGDVRDNLCAQNGVGATITDGAGILVEGPRSRIEGNYLNFNDKGLSATTGSNIITRNQATNNTAGNYDPIAVGNKVGPIVADPSTATNPYSNFSF